MAIDPSLFEVLNAHYCHNLIVMFSTPYTSLFAAMQELINTEKEGKALTTISCDDAYLSHLRDLLTPQSECKSFMTSRALLNATQSLREKLGSTTAVKVDKVAMETVHRLYSIMQKFESVVCQGTKPLLSTPQLQNSLLKLGSVLEDLESAVSNTEKQIETYKKKIKVDPLIQKERRMFIHFFTDPSKFKETVKIKSFKK